MLVVSPVLIHGLGAETYGQWIVLLSLIGYVDLLDLGMSGAAVRYLSLEIGDQKVDGVAEALTFFRRIFRWISLVAGALVFVGVMLLPHLARDVTSGAEMQFVLAVCGGGSAVSYLFRCNVLLLKAHLLYHRIVSAGLVRLVVWNSGLVLVISLGFGLGALALCWVTGLMTELVLTWWWARALKPVSIGVGLFPDGREVFGFGLKSFLGGVAGTLRDRIDVQILAAVVSTQAVAQYSIATRFVTMLTEVMNAGFGAHLLAAFSQQCNDESPRRRQESFLTTIRLSSALAVALGLLLCWVVPPFITLWLGSGFDSAKLVVWILVPPTSLLAAQYPLGAFLASRNLHGGLVTWSLVGAAANGIGSIYLAGRMGLVGVVIPTAIELLVLSSVGLPILVRRSREVSVRKYLTTLAKSVGIVGGAGGTALFILQLILPNNTWPFLICGAVVIGGVAALSIWSAILTGGERRGLSMYAGRRFSKDGSAGA